MHVKVAFSLGRANGASAAWKKDGVGSFVRNPGSVGKPAYLGRAMKKQRSSLDIYVYILSDMLLLVEDLRRRFELPANSAYLVLVRTSKRKIMKIIPSFCIIQNHNQRPN